MLYQIYIIFYTYKNLQKKEELIKAPLSRKVAINFMDRYKRESL